MSGNMNVSIDSILRTFHTEIDFMQPIYEAIANSIDANATVIDIKFYKKTNLLNMCFVDKIEISDNGEGFTRKNIDSFCEYMSQQKISIGGKGIGRFTWLKVFHNVFIESFAENNKVNIQFNDSFDPKANIKIEPYIRETAGTKILFENLTTKYSETEINLDTFKNKIIDYFLIKFLAMKKSGSDLTINLIFMDEKTQISINDLGSLNEKTFSMHTEETDYEFKVDYKFIEGASQKKNECFLCGNGRIVEEYSLKKIITSLPDNKSIKVLIYSQYFDERINDERTAFTFNKTENNPSLTDPIPFNKIKDEITTIIEKIIVDEFPKLEEDNEVVIKECIEEKPYLKKYILMDSSIIKRKTEIIDEANKQFEKEKETVTNNFTKILEEKHIDSDQLIAEFEKMNDLSNRELAQYFLFRQQIIDQLGKLNEENEKKEKLLHDLFLNMGKTSHSTDELSKKYSNCIWLLDDKYMSYDSMFSDKKVDTIKKQIMSQQVDKGDLYEPDLTIFYSNHDIAVVEFKAIGSKTDDKLVAIPEINRNMKVIASNFDNINNIYGYIITKLDEKTQENIESQQGVMSLFTNGNDPAYYYCNNNIKDANGRQICAHIYIMSTETIYHDANMRNKLFIDIIKNR